jgi:hypothetical protein
LVECFLDELAGSEFESLVGVARPRDVLLLGVETLLILAGLKNGQFLFYSFRFF